MPNKRIDQFKPKTSIDGADLIPFWDTSTGETSYIDLDDFIASMSLDDYVLKAGDEMTGYLEFANNRGIQRNDAGITFQDSDGTNILIETDGVIQAHAGHSMSWAADESISFATADIQLLSTTALLYAQTSLSLNVDGGIFQMTTDNGDFETSWMYADSTVAQMGYGISNTISVADKTGSGILLQNDLGAININSASGLRLIDSRVGAAQVGWEYNVDCSPHYTNRSIPDWHAVKNYTDTAINNLLNGAGAAYDTLKELQDLIVNDETVATALAATVAGKANKSGDTFTGAVTLAGTYVGTGAGVLLAHTISPSLTLAAADTVARGFGILPTLVAGANGQTLTALYINPTFTNGSYTGVNNWAINAASGNFKLGSGFVELTGISAPAAPAAGAIRFYSDGSGNWSWIKSDGYTRSFTSTLTANRAFTFQDSSYTIAGTDIDNSFSAKQTFSAGISGGLGIGHSNITYQDTNGGAVLNAHTFFSINNTAGTATGGGGFNFNANTAGGEFAYTVGNGSKRIKGWALYASNNTLTPGNEQTDFLLNTINNGTQGLRFKVNASAVTAFVPVSTSQLNLLDSTYKTALDVNSSGNLRLGNGFSSMSTSLGFTVNNTLSCTGLTSNTHTPSANNTYDSGSNVSAWRTLYTFAIKGYNVTGADQAGTNLTISPAPGTGAGSISSVIIQTPTLGVTGSTTQTLATRLTINSTAATSTVPLLAPDGSGSNAGLGFSSSVNTGLAIVSGNLHLYRSGTDLMAFSSNTIFANVALIPGSDNAVDLGQDNVSAWKQVSTRIVTSNAGLLIKTLDRNSGSASNAVTIRTGTLTFPATGTTGAVTITTGAALTNDISSGNLILTTGTITGGTGARGTIMLADSAAIKMGHWGVTPIVQPTTSFASGTLVSNGGTALTSTDTIDGYTLLQIVKIIRSLGLAA